MSTHKFPGCEVCTCSRNLSQSAEVGGDAQALAEACADMAKIHAALGLDEDDAGGADPIIEAIEDLKARATVSSSANMGGAWKPARDPIHLAKAMLALVDDYQDRPTPETRTALRVALTDTFAKLVADSRPSVKSTDAPNGGRAK